MEATVDRLEIQIYNRFILGVRLLKINEQFCLSCRRDNNSARKSFPVRIIEDLFLRNRCSDDFPTVHRCRTVVLVMLIWEFFFCQYSLNIFNILSPNLRRKLRCIKKRYIIKILARNANKNYLNMKWKIWSHTNVAIFVQCL